MTVFKNATVRSSRKIPLPAQVLNLPASLTREKHNKDIKKIFIDLFEHALQQTEENKKLIKNIFINFNTNHALKMLPINKDKMVLKLELFDFSKYDINEKDKHLIIHIIDTLLIQSISFAFKNIEEKDKIKEIFIKEINIILNGIERRII
jgi:hypothetical protein